MRGGVIGKDLFPPFDKAIWGSIFYIDSATLKPVDRDNYYSENVLFAPLASIKSFYYGLKYHTINESSIILQHVINEGKPTNAISYINTYVSFLQIKCVGVGLADNFQNDFYQEVEKTLPDTAVFLDTELKQTFSINLLTYTPDISTLSDGLYLTPDKAIFIMNTK